MTYISVIDEANADGDIGELYAADRERLGYVPNYAKTFSARPAAYRSWKQLIGAISAGMDQRRYELVTTAAARRLRSTYCMMAHGRILRDNFFDPEVLTAIVRGQDGVLEPVDAAIMRFADKVVADATSVTSEDVEELRSHGLDDGEILDVVMAAAARCFFSKVLDATGTGADSVYLELEPDLRDALSVGRPIAEG
jgi:uncharacterized peroxidase-related enzyme